MRKAFFITFFTLATFAQAQKIIYTAEDSLRITEILDKHTGKNYPSSGELLLAIAEEFLGQRYVAGTLDQYPDEPLFVSTRELDCTTFVELVLAIGTSIGQGEKGFEEACRNLERIRYRNGKRNGYTSRLHYISQWIADSAKQGILAEIESRHHRRAIINLHYMSSHPASYKILKEAPALIKEIEAQEKPFRGTKIAYIPKEELKKDGLPIKNGDIIALTTNIDGLDVVHIGFAFLKEGKAYLLHASSGEGKVVKDNRDLYSYQKNRKNQTGIRIFRMCPLH